MPGIRYRHLSEESLDDMIEVVTGSRAGLPHERRMNRSEAMTYTFLDPDFDPKGTWLVYTGRDVVGFGSANVDSNRVRAGKNDGRFEIDILPSHRGRGIEQVLLEKSLEYLRSRGVEKALARSHLADEWKKSLLLSNSFKEYYRVYFLVREGQPELPAADLPEGFSLERKLYADMSDTEVTAFADAFNESFFDHMNFAPELPQRFINWRDCATDPMLVTSVRMEEEIVGVCLSEESAQFNRERGVRAGWINILGVKLQFRRRGLARAMLIDGIQWVLSRGMDTVYIGVVSDNEKALDLYKSLGFEKEQESLWFELAV